MDACGSLLGPIVAFLLLATLPGAFDVIWVASFGFAALGVAALWLFVPRSAPVSADAALRATPLGSVLRSRRLLLLAGCGALLALTTISDSFIYLLLQQKNATAAGYFPLFYVMTATGYMVFSIPAGRLADRTSRPAVFIGGYVLLLGLYALLFFQQQLSTAMLVGCLALLGLYYAATEGILMALASVVIPPERRTAGIAIVATGVGLGKLCSSIAFGALWQNVGVGGSVLIFGAAMGIALGVTWLSLRSIENES
jgi:MFS family permease